MSLLSDNDENYILLLSGLLQSADEHCSLMITRAPESFLFRIAPSSPKKINSLVNEITNFHTFLGIRVIMSKSIKNSCSIFFKVQII